MQLEEHTIESSSGEYSRKVWFLNAERGFPEKIAVFLDGEFYVHQMDAPSLLTTLQQSGLIPSMVCIFISHLDGEARHHDLTCNPRYSDFIATDVIRWVCNKNSSIPHDNHFIAGPSLGGLASAYLTLTRPELFPFCLSQSGSFWWNNEWLTSNLWQMPSGHSKVWLSVGNKETESGASHPPTGLRQDVTQIAACERFAAALRNQEHFVHYDLYDGGHEIKRWKEELPTALCWLLGKE